MTQNEGNSSGGGSKTGESTGQASTGQNKIERVIERYNLEGMGSELEARWTHDIEERRMSIRELETFFNRAILREVLDEQIGHKPPNYTFDELYDLLESIRDDEASKEERQDIDEWFNEQGVSLRHILTDFMSYYAIFTYLRDVRGAETKTPSPGDEEIPDIRQQILDTMNRTVHRGVAEGEKGIRKLHKRGEFPHTRYEVRGEFKIECDECGTIRPYKDAIRADSVCECDARSEGKLNQSGNRSESSTPR